MPNYILVAVSRYSLCLVQEGSRFRVYKQDHSLDGMLVDLLLFHGNRQETIAWVMGFSVASELFVR
jgi:hypothetical protein